MLFEVSRGHFLEYKKEYDLTFSCFMTEFGQQLSISNGSTLQYIT